MKCKILDRGIVMQNPDSAFGYFGWPTVAKLADGSLLAVASGNRLGHVCPFGKTVGAKSEDEGKTWSVPFPIIDTPLDDRDGGIAVMGDRVVVTSFNNTPAFQIKRANIREQDALKIEDEQKREIELSKIELCKCYAEYIKKTGLTEKYFGSTMRESLDGGLTWGKIDFSPVTSPHGPVFTKEGKLLWVGKSFAPDNDNIECYLIDGENKTLLGTIPAYEEPDVVMSEPNAIILPSGRIIAHIRIERKGENPIFGIAQSVSDDGGKTFSAPKAIVSKTVGAPAHLFLHSSGVLISALSRRKKPFGITVLLSRDFGETWEETYLIDDAPRGDLGYPSTVELKDGSLYTVWYQNETGIAKVISAHWQLQD